MYAKARTGLAARFSVSSRSDVSPASSAQPIAGTIMLFVAVWLIGAPLTLPFDASTAELSILLMAVVHLGAYAGLLYMLSHCGAVFASQISYITTPAAIVWGVVLLDEKLSLSIILALVLILCGLALIKPKQKGQR